MTTTTQIQPTKGFPRAEVKQAAPARDTSTLREIGIGEVRGFPGAGNQECQEWIPGVTGPYGWYDSAAIQALADQRQARWETITSRIVFGIHFTGFVACAYIAYWTLNVLAVVTL